jgi:general secretion pathway protein I
VRKKGVRTVLSDRPGGCSAKNSSDPFFRDGFSLLEVILALAILAGAIAVLGEVSRNGLNNARIARDVTEAQLLCESKLAEITVGITLPEPVTDVPFETTDDPNQIDWLYSIEVEPLDNQGLLMVRVTVVKDLPPEKRPTEFSLVRWVADPNMEMSEEAVTDEASSEDSEAGE